MKKTLAIIIIALAIIFSFGVSMTTLFIGTVSVLALSLGVFLIAVAVWGGSVIINRFKRLIRRLEQCTKQTI